MLYFLTFRYTLDTRDAPETGAINRLHFLTPGMKFLAPKINRTESDVDDEFAAVAALILQGALKFS